MNSVTGARGISCSRPLRGKYKIPGILRPSKVPVSSPKDSAQIIPLPNFSYSLQILRKSSWTRAMDTIPIRPPAPAAAPQTPSLPRPATASASATQRPVKPRAAARRLPAPKVGHASCARNTVAPQNQRNPHPDPPNPHPNPTKPHPNTRRAPRCPPSRSSTSPSPPRSARRPTPTPSEPAPTPMPTLSPMPAWAAAPTRRS
ncbi:hypothetical protein VTK26DRAFT_1619 [Humicola hyalothermophila]